MFIKMINNSVKVVGFILVLLAVSASSLAQNIQFSQGKVEETLNNSIGIPLMNYKGRGLDLPVSLNYSSNVWRIDNINTVLNNEWYAYQTMTQALYAEHSTAGWKSSLDLPTIEFPKLTDTYYSTGREYCYVCNSGIGRVRVAKVTIHMPDGSSHELRKTDARYADTGVIDMAGTFYAVDGSRLRYDGVDADTGTIYMPDGTRYVLDGSSGQIIDRHGNTLSYDGTTRQWTDTIGRVVNMPIPANPQAQDYAYNLPGLAGVNGGLQTYTFKWRNLANALTPDDYNVTPALRISQIIIYRIQMASQPPPTVGIIRKHNHPEIRSYSLKPGPRKVRPQW